MTTPTGAISLYDVALELGIAAAGLNLNDTRVRALAGKPSGAVSLNDLRGKSSGPPLDYTILFSYEFNSGVLMCSSGGGYGSLTPGFSYKGQGIGGFYLVNNSMAMYTSVGFTFTTLTIAGVVFTSASGGGASDGSQRVWSWPANFAGDVYYAMTFAG